MRLKILYIGTFGAKSDEGLSQISKQYYSHFNNSHEVRYLNTFEAIKPSSIKNILKFRPHIIHYLTGPTIRSLIILKLLKILLFGKVKTVVSATRPFFKKSEWYRIKNLKPDMAFTQAIKWQKVFEQNKIAFSYLPNPVNTEKFKKLEADKNLLRQKYGLPLNKKLLLHVGHIRPNRNVGFFAELQQTLAEDYQVVFVGSTHFPADEGLMKELVSSGCLVISRFIENIAEMYNACDYYVFPVQGLGKNTYPENYNDLGAIDMPLSILEALACSLPVISTEIDALDRLIVNKKNSPVYTLNSFDPNEFNQALEKAENQKDMKNFNTIRTQFSQDAVFLNIEQHYKNLCTK